ncbi:type VI secretion system-associated FHA domain protein TagH [Paraferrimonas sedimenticola]|nr:type VI secretion system-associated FHA domain protein TagH [Paraferrimonas sedimenticola]
MATDIIIRITSGPKQDLALTEVRISKFDELVIGRGNDCDWPLNDASRMISREHAAIRFDGEHFRVTDTSTNGVFINGSRKAVGQGSGAQIVPGDTFDIGMYRFEVAACEVSQPATDVEGQLASAHPPNKESLTHFLRADSPSPKPTPTPVSEPAIPKKRSLGRAKGGLFAAPEGDRQHSITGGKVPHQAPIERPKPQKPPATDPQAQQSLDAFLEPESVQPPSTSPAQAPVQAEPARSAQGHWQSGFLQSLGSTEQDNGLDAQTMGLMVRALFEGTFELLKQREQFKREFRLQGTMLQAGQNNPLKFSISFEDAINRMLDKPKPGYLPPEKAVEEVFNDLKQHELALMAAMMESVEALLKGIAPERIADAIDQQGSGLLAKSKEARCWNEYQKLHAELVNGLNDDFNRAFGAEFVKRYERHHLKVN